jgi:hypothetical protein
VKLVEEHHQTFLSHEQFDKYPLSLYDFLRYGP